MAAAAGDADARRNLEREVQGYLDGEDGDDAGANDELNPDVPRLLRAWQCEKSAPELLRYETRLVADLQELLSGQMVSLEAGLHAQGGGPVHPSVTALFQMDVARTRFLLTSYLRTRLAKVRRGRQRRRWWQRQRRRAGGV